MLLKLNKLPQDLIVYASQDETALKKWIKETLKEIKNKHMEVSFLINEIENAIDNDNRVFAYYNLIIFQRTLQDKVKDKYEKELEKNIENIKSQIEKIVKRLCNSNYNVKSVRECCKQVNDIILKNVWDYIYEITSLKDRKLDEMLRNLKQISNHVIHGFKLPEGKIDMFDLVILTYAVRVLLSLL
ncbi:hypothetical protein GFS03_03970 [Sulfolobus sp. E5-1-F]|uniref:hypothetical protein n=1 Tax=Saccharolobus sp. E5-1-F TaxID=2663019 RepID=UPI001294D905|nr:hypothetical protein [Sulfolobus sp. E5-1-F]QGA53801.1 hypothetical protein GFS03_03970 [Sulfolobus sp. E5-1-F]